MPTPSRSRAITCAPAWTAGLRSRRWRAGSSRGQCGARSAPTSMFRWVAATERRRVAYHLERVFGTVSTANSIIHRLGVASGFCRWLGLTSLLTAKPTTAEGVYLMAGFDRDKALDVALAQIDKQ